MSFKQNIAIIGDGVAGLSLAFHLLEQNKFNISVFYDESQSKNSASRIATGCASIRGKRVAFTELFALKVIGHSYLQNFFEKLIYKKIINERDLNKQSYEFFSNQDQYKILGSKVFREQFRAPFYVNERLLSEDFFAKRILTSRLMGYLEFEGDLSFCTHKILDSLKNYLQRNDVQFFNCSVKKLNVNHDDTLAVLADSVEPQIFDKVIVAAGPGCKEIFDASTKLEAPNLFLKAGKILEFNHFFEENFFFMNFESVLVNSCSGFKLGAVSYPEKLKKIDKSMQIDSSKILNLARQVIDEKYLKMSREYIGYRVQSSSRKPLIVQIPRVDSVKNSNVWLMSGFYKSGWQMAYLAANYLGACLQDKADDFKWSFLFKNQKELKIVFPIQSWPPDNLQLL